MRLCPAEKEIIGSLFTVEEVRFHLVNKGIKEELVDLFCFFYYSRLYPRMGWTSGNSCSVLLRQRLRELIQAVRDVCSGKPEFLSIEDHKRFLNENELKKLNHELSPLHIYCRICEAGIDTQRAKELARWFELRIYKPFTKIVIKETDLTRVNFVKLVIGEGGDYRFAM